MRRSGLGVALAVLACTWILSPAVVAATPLAKGELRGSSIARVRPVLPDMGMRASTAEWEPDDNIEYATEIDTDMADGFETLTGSLSSASDPDDVYAVLLLAGERISLSMTGDPSTDFGLYVYGPDAGDIYVNDPVAGAEPFYFGGPDSYPIVVDYTVKQTGYYFINPFTWTDGDYEGGSGGYAVSISMPRQASSLTISSSHANGFLDPTTIDGQVYGARYGTPAGEVTAFFSLDGLAWIPFGTESVGVDGSYSFEGLDSTIKTHYMVTYLGSDAFGSSAASTCFTSYAGLTNVTAARLGTRKYRLSGYLGPQHASGSYPVRVYLWRKVDGRWKAYGYQKAMAGDSGEDTKFSKTYVFPYKGSWRIQAYHSDAGHLATRSGYTYKNVY